MCKDELAAKIENLLINNDTVYVVHYDEETDEYSFKFRKKTQEPKSEDPDFYDRLMEQQEQA